MTDSAEAMRTPIDFLSCVALATQLKRPKVVRPEPRVSTRFLWRYRLATPRTSGQYEVVRLMLSGYMGLANARVTPMVRCNQWCVRMKLVYVL